MPDDNFQPNATDFGIASTPEDLQLDKPVGEIGTVEFMQRLDEVAPDIIRGNLQRRRSYRDDGDINALLGLSLSRYEEVVNPTRSRPGLAEPMDPVERYRAKEYELNRVQSMQRKLAMVRDRRNRLGNLRSQFPEVATRIFEPDWEDKLYTAAGDVAKKGWRALDVILRNLDRGRGALAAYSLAIAQGGETSDARRAAGVALRGAERGFALVPELQAPSWKEVLKAYGYEDDMTTASMGTALDVVIDPVNFLGVGASRKAVSFGAHQLLNSAGRELHGKLLREAVEKMVKVAGKANDIDLSTKEYREAFQIANDEIAHIINKSVPTAEQYLDMGGLKFAGYTLPGTAFVRNRQMLRDGVYKTDHVAESLAKILGSRTLKGMDNIGASLQRSPGRLSQRLGQFMRIIPQHLDDLGRSMGHVLHRTSPRAGKDYVDFKQAHYYDRLSLGEKIAIEKTRKAFQGLRSQDLEGMTMALEDAVDNPGAWSKFVNDVGVQMGPDYAKRVENAATEFRSMMDEALGEEVNRGFFPGTENWHPDTRKKFSQWIINPNSVFLTPKLASKFEKLRIKNYVPHYYENLRLYKSMKTRKLTPGAPSIIETFTHTRIFDKLLEARENGLVPRMNLAEIAAIRMTASSRAITTHDFLEQTAKSFGHNTKAILDENLQIVRKAGKPMPDYTWAKLLKARRVDGRVAMDTVDQLNLARKMAFEPLVPSNAVALLSDAARKEFLLFRFRQAGNLTDAKRMWKKYVEDPTRKGLYDGKKFAPGSDMQSTMAIARDLYDENFKRWDFIKAGGLAKSEALGRVMLPAPIVDDLARIQMNLLPEELRNIMTIYDRMNYWWKRSVTIAFPAFHFRNKITNLVNSAMDIGIAGILDREALWKVMQGGKGILHADNGLRYSYDQVRNLMREHGVVTNAYRRIDVGQMVGDIVETETKTWNRFARKVGIKLPGREELIRKGQALGVERLRWAHPFRMGEDVGQLIENGDRAQLFIKSLQRGMSPEQAARRVNKFLFDYQDISKIEAQFVRRFLFPFWTWTRKNLALQGKLLLNRPGMFITPAKFSRGLSEERDAKYKSDIERELLPKYLNDVTAVRLDVAERWSTWLMNVDLPFEELNRLWEGSPEKTAVAWLSQINPYLRELMESAVEQDFYTGRKHVQFLRGTRVHDLVARIPPGSKMHKWLGITHHRYREQEVIRVNTKRWQMLNWLTLWQASRLYSTVGRAIDPSTGKLPNRLFNLLTGMRIEYIRPDEELRRIGEAMVNDPDSGLAANFNNAYRRYMDELEVKSIDDVERADDISNIRTGVALPEYGAELDMHPGSTWVEEELP
jgi:hypothetical protein